MGATNQPDQLSRRDALAIYLILVSAFVVMLNETVLNVALPQIMNDLRIEPSSGQWLSTAFMLTMAIVIPLSGWLLERFSTRTVFFGAITMFSLGTAMAALAPGFIPLVIGRIVQAAGTGVMMPLLMTTVITLVPLAQRGRMMGNMSIVMSVAPAVGPMLAGLVLSTFNWRWLFWLVLPIALASLLLGAKWLRNVTEQQRVPIDFSSVVLSAFAFGGLVFGLAGLAEAAQGTAIIAPWIPLLLGSAALGGFIWRQLRLQGRDAALLDLRVFRSRDFSVAIVLMMIWMAALFGTMILIPIYVQEVLGMGPLETGLLLLPGGLLMGIAGPFVGRLYDRVGPRALIVPGSIAASASLWAMGLLMSADAPIWVTLCCHIALSLSLALLFTPLFTLSLGSVHPQLYPMGSAVIGTVQQLAGAAGTALFIVIYTLAVLNSAGAGATPSPHDLGAGVHQAFVVGATISVIAIAVSLFVPKVAPDPGGAGPAGFH